MVVNSLFLLLAPAIISSSIRLRRTVPSVSSAVVAEAFFEYREERLWVTAECLQLQVGS